MSKEAMTEVLEAIEEIAKHIGRYDPPMQPNYLVLSLGNQADTLRRLISEQEQGEPVALEALVMICIKCRSNEWGSDTPRKQILNWFHDTASKALEDAQIFRGKHD